MGDLSCQAIGNISVYPLRFELQALRVYTLMMPISFQYDPGIHYLFLSVRFQRRRESA